MPNCQLESHPYVGLVVISNQNGWQAHLRTRGAYSQNFPSKTFADENQVKLANSKTNTYAKRTKLLVKF